MSDNKAFSLDDFGINLDAGGYSLGLDVDKADAPISKHGTGGEKTGESSEPEKASGIEGVIATIKPYALPVGIALLLLIGFAAMGRK